MKSIFVLFIGVVNHWVVFIVRKKGAKGKMTHLQEPYRTGKKLDNKFFLLDSSNFAHLDKPELQIPDVVMDRVRERIKLGLKASSKFQIKMTI
mmetsp:Transcript_22135/g.29591  ORF Transcript_22135/g.29591 Transcript_22135/m.29591 type:complete len:93 (-) Transcript_22135:1480-1758(-)